LFWCHLWSSCPRFGDIVSSFAFSD
jgi:hypothetical protein